MGEAVIATGNSATALFTLKVRRGEGMVLLTMNWKDGQPDPGFVGFAIEFKAPGMTAFKALKNRLSFADAAGHVGAGETSSRDAPFQKFRWAHFPHDAEVAGEFVYRVTPVSMDGAGVLSYGTPQEASVELGGDTYPGTLNVAFTRGFVSSQAFVDRYEPVAELLPGEAKEGLTFKPTNPKAEEAYEWMGFEARRAILAALDAAIADEQAQIKVIAYDLNEPEVVQRLEKLGDRLQMIIDNSGSHGEAGSAENAAEVALIASAGAASVKRQHMGGLQHNKTIVIDSPTTKLVVCGSTNFSWRAFYVQNNNAMAMHGPAAVKAYGEAFEQYWQHSDDAPGFAATAAAQQTDLGIPGVDARVAFSPHSHDNAMLGMIAQDIEAHTTSSLLYSLAFLYQTPGPILDAIKTVTDDEAIFVYGISDRPIGGLDVQRPSGNVAPVSPAELTEADTPEPFKAEPSGGSGVRMHHKFVVIDFDKPTARVYMGSYNFSSAADLKNGENLLEIRDPRVACSYMIEALVMFDHYHFRIAQREAGHKGETLALKRPPSAVGEKPWWDEYYSDPQKARDRELFA